MSDSDAFEHGRLGNLGELHVRPVSAGLVAAARGAAESLMAVGKARGAKVSTAQPFWRKAYVRRLCFAHAVGIGRRPTHAALWPSATPGA